MIGYFWGTHIERKHFAKILQRENELSDIIVIASKYPPEGSVGEHLELGSVVIASDVFKRLVGWLIGIFGGRINVYESLLDRARREAVIRLKEKARKTDSNMIVNLKYETSTIGMGNKNSSKVIVEVLAYGTCVKYSPSNT